MTRVLVLMSSTSGTASVSNQLVKSFLSNLMGYEAGATIVTRDLSAEPLPHLTSKSVAGVKGVPNALAEYAASALSDHLIEEVEGADLLVIASPMHNFGIGSTLKAWFDYVLRADRTFRYGPGGVDGLLSDKRALVIMTRGGAYSSGRTAAMDCQEPHLRTMLNFVGISDVTFIRAENLSMGDEPRQTSVQQAIQALADYAAERAALRETLIG